MEPVKNFSISMAELKLEEFLQFGNDVVNVVKKSNASDLGLAGVLNLAEAGMVEANNYSKEDRKHPLSAEIETLRAERDKRVVALTIHMKGYKQAPADNVKAEVALAVPMLEVFVNGYLKMNAFVKSQRLKMLFAKITSESSFENALQAIGLKALLDEIQLLETQSLALVAERRSTQLEKVGDSTNKIKLNAANMLRKLLGTIETNALVKTELNYKPLIDEVNATIAEYKKLLTIRKAAKKTKATALNATAPAAVTTGTVQNEVA